MTSTLYARLPIFSLLLFCPLVRRKAAPRPWAAASETFTQVLCCFCSSVSADVVPGRPSPTPVLPCAHTPALSGCRDLCGSRDAGAGAGGRLACCWGWAPLPGVPRPPGLGSEQFLFLPAAVGLFTLGGEGQKAHSGDVASVSHMARKGQSCTGQAPCPSLSADRAVLLGAQGCLRSCCEEAGSSCSAG